MPETLHVPAHVVGDDGNTSHFEITYLFDRDPNTRMVVSVDASDELTARMIGTHALSEVVRDDCNVTSTCVMAWLPGDDG